MPPSKKLLTKLYLEKHFSATEIASLLGFSENKVRYWLAKHNIPIRSRSAANYHRYNPDGHPFSIKKDLSIAETQLFNLCLGLYWGEGGKSTHHATRLGNSDPNMIKIFYTFLQTICNVKENKIYFYLQVFKNQSVESAKDFWVKQLNISQDRINTCKPTKPLGKGTYNKINKYGVLTIAVYNIRLKKWMIDELSKIGYNPDIKDKLLGCRSGQTERSVKPSAQAFTSSNLVPST
jgi:hypothetical protein